MKNQKMASSPFHQDKWRRIILAQQASGLSVAAYCREQRIGQAFFYSWKRRLKESPASPRSSHPTSPGFVELTAASPPAAQVLSALPSPPQIEILIGHRHVRVHPGFNHELLGEVIHVLEDLA